MKNTPQSIIANHMNSIQKAQSAQAKLMNTPMTTLSQAISAQANLYTTVPYIKNNHADLVKGFHTAHKTNLSGFSNKSFYNLNKQLGLPSSFINKLNNNRTNLITGMNKNMSHIVGTANKVRNTFNKTATFLSNNRANLKEFADSIEYMTTIYEKYSSDFSPEEFDKMDIEEFIDYAEFNETFVAAFNNVFTPDLSYSLPTSYQMVEDVKLSMNNTVSFALTIDDLEIIRLIFKEVFIELLSNKLNDISHFDFTSLFIQIYIVVMFCKTDNKDTKN